MCCIKEIIKRHKGFSLIEYMINLAVIAIALGLIASTLNIWILDYKKSCADNERITEGYEALMYIDYYIKNKSKSFRVNNNVLYLKTKDDYENKVTFRNYTVYFNYKEHKSDNYYVPQPLLYNVANYNVAENGNVIKVSVELKEGMKFEKTYEK